MKKILEVFFRIARDGRNGRNCRRVVHVVFLLVLVLAFISQGQPALAVFSIPQTDRTPNLPLTAPAAPAQTRYLSGFGLDNAYTIFYEDRSDSVGCTSGDFHIYFNQTTSGPPGLASASTATYIAGTSTKFCETHLLVKNWPITIGSTLYSYRAWGSGTNNGSHHFYVSNDLVNWTLAATFTIPLPTDPIINPIGDSILYGFHDILQLNGHYMGFVESAGGHTFIARSDTGDQNWTVVAHVGGSGTNAAMPDLLKLGASPTPTGNFRLMVLGGQLVYGKLYVPGNNAAAYLIINPTAAQASTPALAETAFLDPTNWTWQDGSIGGPPGVANAVLTASNPGHGINEVWIVPTSYPSTDPVILYTGKYTALGNLPRLGCASTLSSTCQNPEPIDAVDDTGTSVNGFTGGTSLTNVLANDTLSGVTVVPSDVTTTFVSSTNAGVTLSGTDVVVAAGTPAGSYTLTYQICEVLNPTNCDQAMVTVPVSFMPTSVDLLSFTATGGKVSIILKWETTNEINNLGFNLYRATSLDGRRIKINAELIPTKGYPGSNEGAVYMYTDKSLKSNQIYYYWLEAVDISSITRLHGPVDATATPKILIDLTCSGIDFSRLECQDSTAR